MNRYPFVSILTPTYNRRHFIPQYLRLLRSQNYPGKFEVIIADDSDMSIRDVLGGDEIIQYHFFKEKMSLGFKREFLCQQAKGDILVHMDDDDYYSPHRVTHAVDMLTKAENLIAGASQCFFIIHSMMKFLSRDLLQKIMALPLLLLILESIFEITTLILKIGRRKSQHLRTNFLNL